MIFNSIEYLYFFCAAALLLALCRGQLRPYALLSLGLYFYMSWRAPYVLVLLGTSCVDYLAALKISAYGTKKTAYRNKILLACSLSANLGVLFFFKYYNFFAQEILDPIFGERFSTLHFILPLGISFYTFQAMSYVIDVYRGEQEPQRHYIKFLAYVTYFPQLIAGPIERARHLMPQLFAVPHLSSEKVYSGLRLIFWGLFKKSVIADRAAIYVSFVFDKGTPTTSLRAAFATLFFAYQIYCDFSGYTDIARGSSRILGIELMQNFNFPYCSLSIGEFWRRWHISLSQWFRDYVYLPLGGSHGTTWLNARNIIIVFLISGFWHGANWTFIVWGMWHGAALVASNLFPRRITFKPLSWALTFTWVLLGWIFFRAANLEAAAQIFQSFLAVDLNLPAIYSGLGANDFLVLIGAIAFLECVQLIDRRRARLTDCNTESNAALLGMTLFLAAIAAIFGEFRSQAFIYFQF